MWNSVKRSGVSTCSNRYSTSTSYSLPSEEAKKITLNAKLEAAGKPPMK